MCWKFLKSCTICKQKNSWPLLLKSLIKLWVISNLIFKLFEYQGHSACYFQWLELIQEKVMCLCICVCTRTYPYTIQGHLLLKNLSFTIFSIFVWIKALFPQTPDCGELPSHHTWYFKESIFQVLIPEFPTSFSIHWLRWLIQLISEQTLNMEAILEEGFCSDLNRHDPGAQLIKYWDCLNYLFIL